LQPELRGDVGLDHGRHAGNAEAALWNTLINALSSQRARSVA